MIFQEDFEQMRSLEQDLTFLSAKTELNITDGQAHPIR